MKSYGSQCWRWASQDTCVCRGQPQDDMTNEDILEEVGGRQLWNSVVARKLRYFGHIMRKEDGNLEKCIITGMAEGTRGRGRSRRAWSEDIKDWTHLSTEEALRMTRDHAAWRSVVHHAANVHDSE